MRTCWVLAVLVVAEVLWGWPAGAALYLAPMYSVQTEYGVEYGKALINGGADVKSLQLDVRTPIGNTSTRRPALLVVHGGAYSGGTRNDLGSIAKHFTERGIVTFCISYRLTGDNPPNGVSSCIADAKTAVRWVRANHARYGIEPNAIGILGHSAGAYTAVEVDVTDPSVYPCDMPDEAINNAYESPRVQAAIELAGSTFSYGAFDSSDAPLMIVHGTNDPVVPFANAQLLRSLCTSGGVPFEFVPIDNWWHGQDPGGTFVDGVNLYELMMRFLMESLGKTSDCDNDGLTDSIEGYSNFDADSLPNYLDPDSDGDSIPDDIEGTLDTDGDGAKDFLDTDSDGDAILDKIEGTLDADGDGTPNVRDLDSDGDGLPDRTEGIADTDGDGQKNFLDLDSDSDGIGDLIETGADADGDGLPDYLDLDSDNDGWPDAIEGAADVDGDGVPNYLDVDSDGDNVSDAAERGLGFNPYAADDAAAVSLSNWIFDAAALAAFGIRYAAASKAGKR